jgi:hypothetical protein
VISMDDAMAVSRKWPNGSERKAGLLTPEPPWTQSTATLSEAAAASMVQIPNRSHSLWQERLNLAA